MPRALSPVKIPEAKSEETAPARLSRFRRPLVALVPLALLAGGTFYLMTLH